MSGYFDLHSLPLWDPFSQSGCLWLILVVWMPVIPDHRGIKYLYVPDLWMNNGRSNIVSWCIRCCYWVYSFAAFSSQWQNLMASVDESLSGMKSLSTVFSDFCNQPVMIYTQSNLLRIQQGLADMQRLVTNMQKCCTEQFTSMWSRS